MAPSRCEVVLAAEVLLERDTRDRSVMVDETLRHFNMGGSDAARCVTLAAAKMAYIELHPETAKGRARKPKKGGNSAAPAVFAPFDTYAEGKIGGWKARTISNWCKIGAGLSQAAYERLDGSPMVALSRTTSRRWRKSRPWVRRTK